MWRWMRMSGRKGSDDGSGVHGTLSGSKEPLGRALMSLIELGGRVDKGGY